MSRPPRGCGPPSLAAGHHAALRSLDAYLPTASWLSEIYEVGLHTVRRSHPSACAVLLEVDAERLSTRWSDGALSSPATRRLTDRLVGRPLVIDGEDLAAIDGSLDMQGGDPLQLILERRLQLNGPAIGRMRLDGAVVALLVLDRPKRRASAADRLFLQQVAERVSKRMDSAMDAYFADLVDMRGCSEASRDGDWALL